MKYPCDQCSYVSNYMGILKQHKTSVHSGIPIHDIVEIHHMMNGVHHMMDGVHHMMDGVHHMMDTFFRQICYISCF